MFAELLNLMTNHAKESDLETQSTTNSMSIRLRQKQSAAKISDIHAKFDVEKEQIRSEINGLDDDASSAEYQELMSELNDLKSEEEQQVEVEEQASEDYETGLQLENDNIATRLEAMKADDEAIEKCLEDNVEQNFGYFQ